MIDKHQKAAEALVDRFRKVPCVKSIVAYGSFARGDYKEDSDIDLAILLDSEKLCHSDAARLIRCVRRIQRRYRVRLEPDFFLDEEIGLFNQGVLLDGRAFSDAYMYNRDGRVLFGQDFRNLFVVPQKVSHLGKNLLAIVEQHFKEWLLHNLEGTKVPNWMVSWTIIAAANAKGSINIASREDSFAALEKLFPAVTSSPIYQKFKEGGKKREILTPDEYLTLFRTLKSSIETDATKTARTRYARPVRHMG